jgi:hypothetical protein
VYEGKRFQWKIGEFGCLGALDTVRNNPGADNPGGCGVVSQFASELLDAFEQKIQTETLPDVEPTPATMSIIRIFL